MGEFLMRNLYWIFTTFTAVSLLSGNISVADDASCRKVNRYLDPQAERQLFYLNGAEGWRPVPESGLQLSPFGTAQFIYVAREQWNDKRFGVLVVKTGRKIGAGEADLKPTKKQLNLERLAQYEFDTCGSAPSFQGTVAAQEYDRFHDYGYAASDTEDGRSLKQFHTSYTGRGKVCAESTDNTTFDAPSRSDWRNNRSQFSFDESVVRGGFYSQIVAGATIGGAAAVGSIGLAGQRVSVTKYSTNEQKIACIPIQVDLAGRNFFLRINDLDDLRKPGRRFIRPPELSRQLSN
jgi:hypothetical protein